MLGVSIDTLRRWDKEGTLKAIRIKKGGHRYYNKKEIGLLMNDLPTIAKEWARNTIGQEPHKDYYCSNAPLCSRTEEMEYFSP